MSDKRLPPCPFRHGNGNCLCVGGFCTAVPDTICESIRNAYDSGFRDGAKLYMERIVERLEEQFKYNAEQAEIWRSGENVDAIMIDRSDGYLDRANCYGKAIRIVKAGGVNE